MPDSRKPVGGNDRDTAGGVRRWHGFARAAGIRGVNGVNRQAPLASGGVLVLGVNQRSGDNWR